MPAGRILAELAGAKTELRRRIAARRAANCALVATAIRPLFWLDLACQLWRQLAPWFLRSPDPLGRMAGTSLWHRLWRWAPAVAALLRNLWQARAG